MRKRLVYLVALLSALALVAALATRDATASGRRLSAARRQRVAVQHRIDRYRSETWHWQRVMGVARTPTVYSARRSSAEAAYRRWVLRLWQHRAERVRSRAVHPPHRGAWLCIHRYEGSWGAATGNGYYGGLQMDISFQHAYGGYLLRREGTANHWSPVEQMWVAERALRSGRGYYPWPNTARACGLI